MFSVGQALLYALLFGFALGAFQSVLFIISMLCGAGSPEPPLGARETVTLPLIGACPFIKKGGKAKKAYSATLFFIADILFFTLAGVALAVFVYSVGGIFRLSYVFFALCGLFLFSRTFGRLLSSAMAYILFFLRVVFLYFVHFAAIPVLFLWRRMKKVFLVILGCGQKCGRAAMRAGYAASAKKREELRAKRLLKQVEEICNLSLLHDKM